MGTNQTMKNGIIPSAGLIAVLDVGTSKTSCFIARTQDDAPPRVIGVGHHASRGVRAGAIVDMEAAESCIRKVVHDTEKMAGETVTGVIANLSAGRPQSRSFAVEVPIVGRQVSEIDLRRAVDQARQVERPGDSELIHSLPVGYSIDGDNGIRDPRGMYGDRLGVNMHMITAAGGAVRNLKACIERAHLDMECVVVSAYASGLASLVEDEMNLGATVIDMGAGTTTVAIFHEGQVIVTDGIPVGGAHVTNDIARGLSTPVVHAERMKTLFGSAIAASEDEREVIDVPQVGEDHAETPNHVPRSILNGIIQPRLEETFELIRARIEASGAAQFVGRRVVLTGGASQLQNARELAAQILDRHVRLGRPLRLRGLAESVSGPAFATCAGLVNYGESGHGAWHSPVAMPETIQAGLFGRMGEWLREHF